MAAASAPPATETTRAMCPGTSKQTHKPCGLGAGHGTDHPGFDYCKFHGGSTPNGRKHAAKVQALALAQGKPVEPHDALREALEFANGLHAFFAAKVAALDDTALLSKGELATWLRHAIDSNRERAQLAKVSIDAGVDERRVRLAEQLVGDLANAIDSLLSELGVRNHPDAPAAVRRALALVEGPRALEAVA